jgi:hypothetical protein
LKEVILYLIDVMTYKCFILTRNKHFLAYNAPLSGALVTIVIKLGQDACLVNCLKEIEHGSSLMKI